ncbi:MAG: hypothetical protein RIC14_10795 [Filomicrobium sp.]
MAKLVTVWVFYDRSEALVAKSMLEAHGIYADVPDWFLTTNAWHFTVALQGIRLNVFDRDAPVALELLKRQLPGYEEPEAEASIFSGVFAFFSFFFAGLPYPVRKRKPDD